jgi:hypothetical protein
MRPMKPLPPAMTILMVTVPVVRALLRDQS